MVDSKPVSDLFVEKVSEEWREKLLREYNLTIPAGCTYGEALAMRVHQMADAGDQNAAALLREFGL